MADVTANLRSLWRDYRHIGESLWERFNAPKNRQAWFYGAVQDKMAEMQQYMETAEVYWVPHCWMPEIHFAESVSRETPTISKPLSLYICLFRFLYMATGLVSMAMHIGGFVLHTLFPFHNYARINVGCFAYLPRQCTARNDSYQQQGQGKDSKANGRLDYKICRILIQ